ncbi:reverse transcriptase domain-containing protein [Tanacetum coccineum]
MRTRSSSNFIVESFTILKRRNRRRSKQIVKPEIRTIIETPVVTMADTRTMSELLQAPTEGYRDAIVIPAILAENFELKVGLLQLTTNLKNDITIFQQKFEETFSEAWDRFKELLRKWPHHSFLKLHKIDTFYNALTQSDQDSSNAAAGGNLLNRTPRDTLTIIENKSKVRMSRNKPIVSKVTTTTSSSSPSPDVTALTEMVKELVLMNKANQQASVKAVDEICVTCGRPHPYYECLATDSNTFNAYAARGTYNQGGPEYRPQGDPNYRASNQMGPLGFPPPNVQNNQNYNRPSGSGSLPSNTIANPRGDLKVITTRSGVSYDGPTIPPISSPLPKEVERELEATKDKFLQIFQRLHFDLSFADALLYMPKFASTFKSLLSNKEKLFELANNPLNENCSAVLLKKLPKKLGDPGKFLIPCDFPELDECLALADLGTSINLMPLSVWKKLFLSELTPTRMTLELANRSVAYPVGVAEDVFVKVGTSINRFAGEELTLRVNDEAITFNVRHTSRYSYRYDDESVNRIDVIDVTCEEYAQEVKGGDFVLKEIEACLTSDSIPPGIDDVDFDLEGYILLLEKLLNDDPSSPLPPKELHFEELKMIKSSIDDPLELELKDLPSHLEYVFLEGTNKLPVIIAKNLKDNEKGRLLKVLKSHKRAIACKISDIKGIDP